MYEAQSTLYIAAIALCVFSIGLLRTKMRAFGRPSFFVFAFLAVEAVCFLFEWLMVHPESPAKALWLGSLMATSFLSAPLLWLAAKEIIQGSNIHPRNLSGWHISIIGLGFVLCLPLLSTMHGGTEYANPENVASNAKRLFIHATMLVCIILYCFQVPYYLVRIYRLVFNQSRHQQGQGDAAPSLAPIRLFILILCSAWLLGILRTVHCIIPGESSLLQVLFTALDVGTTVGVLYAILSQTNRINAQTKGPSSIALQDSSYSKSTLKPEIRSRILQKLTHTMEQEYLYCDNLLSLRSLSAYIKESPYHVSQVLNQELNTNFYRFVNNYRIEHAKRALLESPNRNVLEIAFQVGFNSKSTFNTAFRQATQTTPSKYRARV